MVKTMQIDAEFIESRIETDRQRKLYETLQFILKLLFFGLIFRLILVIYPDTYPIQSAFASLIGTVLSPFMQVHVNGIYILTAEASYVIVQDCLGWKSMAVFTALFLSATTKFREQAKYLLYGLIGIFIANVVRVASTVYLSEIGVVSFEVIHTFLWRWGLTFIVLLIWLYWYRYILNAESEEADQEADTE